MTAERLNPVRRRLDDFGDKTLVVIVVPSSDTNVHDITGYGERNEHNGAIPMSQCFAFSGTGFDRHVLQQNINFFLGHWKGSVYAISKLT